MEGDFNSPGCAITSPQRLACSSQGSFILGLTAARRPIMLDAATREAAATYSSGMSIRKATSLNQGRKLGGTHFSGKGGSGSELGSGRTSSAKPEGRSLFAKAITEPKPMGLS